MNTKKIFITLCGLLLFAQSMAFAEISQSQVANVRSISSSFSYKDPIQMKEFLAKKVQQEAKQKDDSEEKEKLMVPPTLFQIYVNNDRFYNEDATKYKERIDIAFTSHNMNRNYIFDKECPPYLIVYNKNDVNGQYVMKFKQFKFDNPYWISFSLTKDEIKKIKNAEKVTVILPEATENTFEVDKRKQKIVKKPYKTSMKINEMSYDLPEPILREWKETLSEDSVQ